MSPKLNSEIAVIGIDIGKNSFHVVGLDRRGAIVLRQKWSRGQVETRLATLPPCLIGMEACVGAHYLSRKLTSLGHDARLMPAKYVRPLLARAEERLPRCRARLRPLFLPASLSALLFNAPRRKPAFLLRRLLYSLMER
jgi:transposase